MKKSKVERVYKKQWSLEISLACKVRIDVDELIDTKLMHGVFEYSIGLFYGILDHF